MKVCTNFTVMFFIFQLTYADIAFYEYATNVPYIDVSMCVPSV